MTWMSNLPKQLMLQLIRTYGLSIFVETGTKTGETTETVIPHFEQAHTIELDPRIYLLAYDKLRIIPNVCCWFGDSPKVLEALVPMLTKPALFWLDAHYSGPETAKSHVECPMLLELGALKNQQHDVIVIDDARMFMNKEDYGFMSKFLDPAQWPTLEEIKGAVAARQYKGCLYKIGDVLVITPFPFVYTEEACVRLA